jgi:hypothetical protein
VHFLPALLAIPHLTSTFPMAPVSALLDSTSTQPPDHASPAIIPAITVLQALPAFPASKIGRLLVLNARAIVGFSIIHKPKLAVFVHFPALPARILPLFAHRAITPQEHSSFQLGDVSASAPPTIQA